MFVDREDYDHMVNQLNGDIPLLVKKFDDMKSSINKKLEKIKLYGPKLLVTKWKNHQTNVQWMIYYNVSKINGKSSIQFIPITSFNDRDGTKSYFVLCLEILNSKSAEYHLFKVFRGHFITQYINRTQSKNSDPYLTIIYFIIGQDLTLNYEYKQNEKWRMFFDSHGIAMVRVDRLCLVFDTFILFSDLKPDQENAIKQYIDERLRSNPEDLLISFLVLFKPGSRWIEFITPDVITQTIRSTNEKNPELAREVVRQLAINAHNAGFQLNQ